jgi:transcriptional regulator with XRE-family HTH domain
LTKHESGFGGRLAEERKRLGLTQEQLAQLLPIDAAKQSLLETGARHLRASYLAHLPSLGFDVLYVLTGSRSNVAILSPKLTELTELLLALPPPTRALLACFAQELAAFHLRHAGAVKSGQRTKPRTAPQRAGQRT